MKIREIVDVDTFDIPEKEISHIKNSDKLQPMHVKIDDYEMFMFALNDQMFSLLLLDPPTKEVALVASFKGNLSNKSITANSIKALVAGKKLAVKLYSFLTNHYDLFSSHQQSKAGRNLWVESLPKAGLNPVIYDTTTSKTIGRDDPNFQAVFNVMYAPKGSAAGTRYVWLLPKQ